MRTILIYLMALDAAVFFLGAMLHAGIAIGPLAQPVIIPAVIVEAICGIALAWGAIALLDRRPRERRAALAANLIALGGVTLGILAQVVARHLGWGAIALDHRVMLALIAASLGALSAYRPEVAGASHA